MDCQTRTIAALLLPFWYLSLPHTAAAAENIFSQGNESMTPHDSFSSSVGVLGCKINTSRVAYWPGPVDCNDICVRVTHDTRALTLLRVDSSTAAFDISYDAWNILAFGVSATESPQVGGGVMMTYETVAAEECRELLDNGNLPLSAANSMNFLHECLQQPNTFVAQHHRLYNILDPTCKYGIDEVCALHDGANQPECPGVLGSNSVLDLPMNEVSYGTVLKE